MLSDYLSYMHLTEKSEMSNIFQNHDISTTTIPYKDELDLVFEYLELLPEIKQAIYHFYSDHRTNKKLLESAALIRWFTVQYAHPSLWLIDQEPDIDGIDRGTFSVFSLLMIAAYQLRIYIDNNIDEKHIYFNFNHLKNYINNYYNETNLVGTSNYTWNIYLASLGLIHLHTLHFMHHVFTDRFMVFKHKDILEKIIIAQAGIDVRKDGQYNKVNNIDDYWFTTTYEDTPDTIKGYLVNPYGAITNTVVTIRKTEYTLFMKPGDYTIDYHIPTGPGYNIKDVQQSFTEAISFFKKVYPQHNYKAFWCVSWLSSPQIPLFLSKSTGNIYQINEQSYSLPGINGQESILDFVFHDKEIDLSTIKPKTSLEKDIIDYNLKGSKINCGVYLYFIEDLPLFGTNPYRNKKHFVEFQNLNILKTT